MTKRKTKDCSALVVVLRKKLKDLEWASRKTNEGIKLLYRQLQKKNEKLKELDRLRAQFVANVAHELKSPLTTVEESVRIILDGLTGDVTPKEREILEVGKNTISRLLRLVTNLLDLSQREMGYAKLNIGKINVEVLLDEILASYKSDLEKKKLVLKKQINKEACEVEADKDKLSEVIINLLTNAMKYTPAGGVLSIRILGNKSAMRFEIEDTGPGIPRAYHKKIFDKFERIMAEKQEGTGLGLPIAKDIVEMHKGRMFVKSPLLQSAGKKAKGSKFIFILPRTLSD